MGGCIMLIRLRRWRYIIRIGGGGGGSIRVAVFIILFVRERGKDVNAWGVFCIAWCGFSLFLFLGLREEGEVYICRSIVPWTP